MVRGRWHKQQWLFVHVIFITSSCLLTPSAGYLSILQPNCTECAHRPLHRWAGLVGRSPGRRRSHSQNQFHRQGLLSQEHWQVWPPWLHLGHGCCHSCLSWDRWDGPEDAQLREQHFLLYLWLWLKFNFVCVCVWCVSLLIFLITQLIMSLISDYLGGDWKDQSGEIFSVIDGPPRFLPWIPPHPG